MSISFVVTGRNDDYENGFITRMKQSVSALLEQSNKYDLNMELIIIEWNPPPNKPKLQEALNIHDNRIRILEVSNRTHRKYPMSDKLPLLEFAAKNVGIQIANGDYILATNPDILFSDEMIEFLATEKLSKNYFYRAIRYDLENGKVVRMNYPFCSIDKRLGISPNVRQIIYGLIAEVSTTIRKRPKPFTNASGDFLLMHRDNWQTLGGYNEIIGADKSGRFHIDGIILYSALQYGLKQSILKHKIYHLEHTRTLKEGIYNPEIEKLQRSML